MRLTLIIALLFIASPLFAASDSDYLKQGNALLASGRPGKAVKSFEQAVQANPQSAEAYKGLGMAYYRLGDNEGVVNTEMLYKAVYAFDNAVNIKPDAETYYYLGVTWLALNDRENAGKVCEILKGVDRQKGEELAAKITAQQKPQSFHYLDNEHNRAEEQKEAEQDAARQKAEADRQQRAKAQKEAEQAKKEQPAKAVGDVR